MGRRSVSIPRPATRHLAVVLAIVAGLVVFLLATRLFPYHTTNHDEAVYLQQAAMLLEGKLTLAPPVPEAFHPWFFVQDGATFYPKYSPVAAAMFAVGKLLGGFRIALALVGAATVWLTHATVTEAFDRTTGLAAAGLLAASPLFLVQASVFLPYVPTLCLNLLFAWAYLRADRTGDVRFAALAGGAIGLAFFARPYTAVLFATPFVCHALWTLRDLDREAIRRQSVTASLGLGGVALALAYNAALTGSATTFPYQAFAPEDGLGFGHRELLGYGIEYSIPLAIEAGLQNLAAYVTRWSVAAPFGVLAAVVGVAVLLRDRAAGLDGRRLAVAGLFLTIPVGELYFWGTLNVLGDLNSATDGLIHTLGPYYHIGLLVPTSAFAAVALVAAVRRFRSYAQSAEEPAVQVGALMVFLLGGLFVLGTTLPAAAGPLGDNAEVTDRLERAYEPVEERDFENALVYLPTVYGNWLNHPFQALRNEPGYGGDAVYALDVEPFAVADAFPERQRYRYAYRGVWNPRLGSEVTPRLQPVEQVTGDRVGLDLETGLPDFTERVSVRVSGADGSGYATVVDPGADLALTLVANDSTVRVDAPAFEAPVTVPYDDRETLEVRLFVDGGGLAGMTYRAELPLRVEAGTVSALTPRLEVCSRPSLCDGAAAYVPGEHRPGISMNTSLVAEGT